MTVTRGNLLQIAENQANLKENVWQCVWQRVQVMVMHCIMA